MVLVQRGLGEAQAVCMQHYSHAESFAQLSKGDVFFVPCDTALQVKGAGPEGLLLWIASVNSAVFGSENEKAAANGHGTGEQVLANGHVKDGVQEKKQKVHATA